MRKGRKAWGKGGTGKCGCNFMLNFLLALCNTLSTIMYIELGTIWVLWLHVFSPITHLIFKRLHLQPLLCKIKNTGILLTLLMYHILLNAGHSWVGKNESESMKGQYREGCKGGWGGGRKYNKQGSARKGGKEGRGGKMKGEERRGKGGHEERGEGAAITLNWQVWLHLHAQFPSCTM